MSNGKFNPAPVDKHAASPKQAVADDKKQDAKLKEGLEETFPASDPVSAAQPAKSTPTPILPSSRRTKAARGMRSTPGQRFSAETCALIQAGRELTFSR
jgi:hypothetical protein